MRYPEKSGMCEIFGCNRTPTDWHHVISRSQIEKRSLPKTILIDRGNLKEFCRYHHMMTTSWLVRERIEKISWEGSFHKRKNTVQG